MKREHDIAWFLKDPNRLLLMKPFTRGGFLNTHGFEGQDLLNNMMIATGFTNTTLYPISQDQYICEYRPDLHRIIWNKSIPHIKVRIDGADLPMSMVDMTEVGAFQKIIHSAHVRNLTANDLEFSLYDTEADDNVKKVFGRVKQEWNWRGMEWWKYQAVNICKQLGNCGILFSFDKTSNKYNVSYYSYEDGYQIIPNYDEYGNEVARSLAYLVDGNIVIDTYDLKTHYRCRQAANDPSSTTGWEIESEPHGYPVCPLLHKRGKVAWEYAQSCCEMWELMTNIAAIALKRFGTFALAFWGEMDKDSFHRDSSTLIINLSSDTTQGKQDVKTLEFPEPQTMDKYLKTLEEKIALFSSSSFITPKDITTSNSGGNGIALAMSNDYALATQSAREWSRFVNEMVYLHQLGMDLETNGTEHYASMRIGAKMIPWSLETNNTKITNLAMEGTYLSTQTMLERCPDAAPDELDRVLKERGALVARDSSLASQNADKALNIARNRNDMIADNVEETIVEEGSNVNT